MVGSSMMGEATDSTSALHPEKSSSFVILTKGNDGDSCDTKTVLTDDDSFSQNSLDQQQNKRQEVSVTTQRNELDWSFLREGELFDRQQQQRQLLDAFHRQMIVENTTNKIVGGDRDSEPEERSQSFRVSARFSSCSFRVRTKEFVLVSGLSGTGKTILVEETLKRLVVERGGYFLLGKLDQLNKTNSGPQRPYAPFVVAFSSLVDSVLTNSSATNEIRAAVSSKMTNHDVDILVDTFPTIGRLLLPERKDSDGTVSKSFMNGADNQTQLARVVRIFLETICDPEKRPIVFLIDDLQWADQGTLVLLKALLSENEDNRHGNANGLFLVGTCRHNEVDVEDNLAELLRCLEDEENVTICQIEIFNLSRPVCGELFARVLGVPRENYTSELAASLDPLVDIAYEQTKGNAFFLLQFIRSLHEEGYLHVQTQPKTATKRAPVKQLESDDDTLNTSDTSPMDNSGKQYELMNEEDENRNLPTNWIWSEEAIRSSRLHGSASVKQDAVSILFRQIKRLSPEIQQTLLVASCLGAEFDKDVLQMAMTPASGDESVYSAKELNSTLELLLEKDFLRSDTGRQYYRFRHDKIQQAAISLIDDNERALFCTNIGRRILQKSGCEKNGIIFLIVNFFSRGISEGIITDRSERQLVAELAMEAGEIATSMSDFVTAATYFDLGIRCLQSNYIGIRYGYWNYEYDFSLAIFSAAAEVEKCNSNFERMESLIKEILQNAQNIYDKMRAYTTMINSLGIRDRLPEAIAQGFSLLEVLGERFPATDHKIFLLFDLIKTKRMLKSFDGDLDRLPEMKNREKLAAIEILNLIFCYCMALGHPKAPLAIFRMVQLTVKYGIADYSATGFVTYGMVLCGLGDFRNGNRFGKIALRLLDHFEAKHLSCRVNCLYYGWTSNWNRPLAMNLGAIMDANRAGLSSGDIEFFGVSATVFATNSFHAGRPLEGVDFEVTRLYELIILFRQDAARVIISPILQQIYNLREGGKICKVPWILSGNACIEEELMAEATASKNIFCLSQFNFRKLWMAYVFNNYEYALEMADLSFVTVKSSPSSFFVYSHHFFEGMTCMALARSSDNNLKKKKYVRRAKRSLKRMKKFNDHCKRNCLNKFLMLEAELLIIKGDLSGGLILFDKAASVSEEEGFMHEKAIAYERAGLAVLHAQESTPERSQSKSNYSTEAMLDEMEYSHIASNYFSKAISSYQDWGAQTKVDQMLANGFKL